MKVFKFGGASLKNSQGVRNVAAIIASQSPRNLLVVVSAMGKTTDMLERILTLAHSGKEYFSAVEELKKYHEKIIGELFQDPTAVVQEVDRYFNDIDTHIGSSAEFDQIYDQIVSKGELVSSVILQHYLISTGIKSV